MEEVISIIDDSGLRDINKERLIEILKKNYNEILRTVEGTPFESCQYDIISLSLQRALNIFFHENEIEHDKVVINSTSLSKCTSILIESIQILKKKGL